MIEILKEHTLSTTERLFQKTNFAVIDRFIIYEHILFYEYESDEADIGQPSITIGLSKLRKHSEAHILLFKKTVTEIQQNIVDYTKEVAKPFTPMVFTVDFTKKRWLKMKPSQGNYLDGTILYGRFKEVFDIIISGTHRTFLEYSKQQKKEMLEEITPDN